PRYVCGAGDHPLCAPLRPGTDLCGTRRSRGHVRVARQGRRRAGRASDLPSRRSQVESIPSRSAISGCPRPLRLRAGSVQARTVAKGTTRSRPSVVVELGPARGTGTSGLWGYRSCTRPLAPAAYSTRCVTSVVHPEAIRLPLGSNTSEVLTPVKGSRPAPIVLFSVFAG